MTAPPDQNVRDRLVSDLDATIFVEAAAGSGKTKSLVGRVLALIAAGVDVRRIVAITFTDQAAAELRDRTRRELRSRLEGEPERAELWRRALDDLDDAAIGTLHGFAHRLLSHHPVEAGLPLEFDVADQIASQIDARRDWRRRSDLLLGRVDLVEDLAAATAAGLKIDQLRELGAALDQQWDLVELSLFTAPEAVDPATVAMPLINALTSLCARTTECSDSTDGLQVALEGPVAACLEELRAAASDRAELVRVLSAEKPTFKFKNTGRAANWEDKPSVVDDAAAVAELRETLRGELLEPSLRRLVCALAADVERAAEERLREGRLSFDDLLVLARRLLVKGGREEVPAHENAVLRDLQENYTHILIDEFQDTDRRQLDIAVRLTSDADDDAPPEDLRPLAGRLFTVGDPQQSIYRFRGADLALYMQTAERLTSGADAPGRRERLTTNFRSTGPVVDLVNQVFAQLIIERPGSQPAYSELVSSRGDLRLAGPAVLQLGEQAQPYGSNIESARSAEGADIAAVVARCAGLTGDEPWQVAGESDTDPRPAVLSDIAILLPRRAALPQITDALEDAGIPYRTESSGLVYASTEIQSLITTLRALADPDDQFSLVSALRSELFGCGDDDLLRHRSATEGRFRWKIQPPQEGQSVSDPVVAALAELDELRRDLPELTPSTLLERLARERGLFELATLNARPRDVWRRVRFVIDQARAWAESGGGSLADYVEWVDHQLDDRKAESEAILPETDDEAVRLMTVHAAKGLEFPIVICAGLANVKTRTDNDPAVAIGQQSWDFMLSSKLQSRGWKASHADEAEIERDELLRLLYVAATRARDHLVLSTHRLVNKGGAVADLASWLAAALKPLAPEQWQSGPGGEVNVTDSQQFVDLPEFASWQAELETVLKAAAADSALAVTRLAHDAADDARKTVPTPAVSPPEGEDAPPQRFHGGKAFGSAVHEVLQLLDLKDLTAARSLAPRLAAQHCFLLNIVEDTDKVTACVLGALASAPLAAVSTSRHLKELWVSELVDDVVHEGVVDLLYETPEGWVILDYKTDRLAASQFDAAAESYRRQVAIYAEMLERTQGIKVVAGILLHLLEEEAHVHEVPLGG